MLASVASHRRFVGLLLAVAACGGATTASHPTASTSAAPSAQAAPQISVTPAEANACGPKQDVAIDSLACLVAAHARRVAGDEAGARKVLAYGCDHDDVDACRDLRALEPNRAAEIDKRIDARCAALGDLGKKLAACARGRTTDAVTDGGKRLPYALALDLRASVGPTLLPLRGRIAEACAAARTGATVATLDGSPLASDSTILDAAILCSDLPASAIDIAHERDGVGIGTVYTVRSLHDSLLSEAKTLQLQAPVGGGGVVGVYCPSLLVDDDHAADVWLRVTDGDATAEVLASVRTAEACTDEKIIKANVDERAGLTRILAPSQAAVEDALAKLADACDAGPAALDTKKSPLAGAAIERTSNVVSFEPHCSFGYRSFAFVSSKPPKRPGSLHTHTEYQSAGGHRVKVVAIDEMRGQLELTLRRRNAELVVAVHP